MLGVLPGLIIWILAATVDENYGGYILVALPAAGIAGVIAVALSAIGLVIALRQGSRHGWPVAGLVLGLPLAVMLALVLFAR